ncbi:DNRLRE domain-containing protein [Lujinxingia vulgaris]|uniref:DNRLRE domain-containing protein n=1 Tax=Lujinxingia vulgaris TaxID=2600176 RepID=A0A5C6X3F8_9DELT|nr:DNRLRE domain-containing protein [Lujinxingia vulgaris]TXD34074.1 DNRLRE domain-containing protein [Lujinxingia vulgaris]
MRLMRISFISRCLTFTLLLSVLFAGACNLDDSAQRADVGSAPDADLLADVDADPDAADAADASRDTCLPSCHPDATCLTGQGDDPTCVCDAGFEGDGFSCTPIDPCLEDNGGCGDPAFFACTPTGPAEAQCAAIDLCATDNGGCGDPERFACLPQSGQAPRCRLIGSCEVVHALPLLEDTFVSEDDPERTFESEPFLVVQSFFPEPIVSEFYGYEAHRRHATYLKFDLDPLPTDLPLIDARLHLRGMPQVLHRRFLWAMLHHVSSDWRGEELNLQNSPEILRTYVADGPIAWEDPEAEQPVELRSSRLSSVIDAQRDAGGAFALQLESDEEGAFFYSGDHPEAEKHPGLAVTLRHCEELPVGADANATVSNRRPDSALSDYEGLVADRDRQEFYLRFDLSALPVGARIVDVHLELSAIDAADFGGDATFTLDALTTEVWDESSVTYATRPEATGEPLATFTLGEPPGEDEVIERVTLATNALFMTVVEGYETEQSISLRVTARDDAATFAGRNHENEALRPRLRVIYD